MHCKHGLREARYANFCVAMPPPRWRPSATKRPRTGYKAPSRLPNVQWRRVVKKTDALRVKAIYGVGKILQAELAINGQVLRSRPSQRVHDTHD